MSDEQVAEFLEAIWGSGPHSLCWPGTDKRFVARFARSPDDVLEVLDKLQDRDTWIGAHPLRCMPDPGRRGGDDDVVEVVAVPADLDWEHWTHRTEEKLPTEEELRWQLSRVDPAPSIVVCSGHGLQPWWLLDRPVSPEEGKQLVAQLDAALAAVGLENDRTDLASILRLPGTRNHKGGEPVPVVIEKIDVEERFDPKWLHEVLPRAGFVPRIGAGTRHHGGSVTDEQQKLCNVLIERYGGHSVRVDRGGEMYLHRPGKEPGEGHGASIIVGDEGDALLTVHSDAWPGLAKGSYVYGVDGELHHPADPLARITIVSGSPRVDRRLSTGSELPDRFWQRPRHAAVKDAALAVGVSPEALMVVVIAAVAAHIPPVIVFPGRRRGVPNLLTAVIGEPGGGKGTALDRALELVPPPRAARQFKPGTAQGLVKQFFESVLSDPNDPKSPKQLARHSHPVILRVDEIAKFAAATGRSDNGRNLIAELKQGVFGEALGQTVATDDKNLSCPPRSYRLVGMLGVAPGIAGPLFDDIDGGLPQRLLFANLLRPDQAPTETLAPFDDMTANEVEADDGADSYTPLDPLSWSPPLLGKIDRGFRDSESVAKRIAVMNRTRWPLLDAHVPYLTHGVAAVLAYLDERWLIQPADLTLAGDVIAVSQAARTQLLERLGRDAARGAKQKRDARISEATETASAVHKQKLDLELLDYARRIVAQVRALTEQEGKPPTVRELSQNVKDRGRWRLAYDEAKARGWLVEEEQPTGAGGSPRRAVIVTDEAP